MSFEFNTFWLRNKFQVSLACTAYMQTLNCQGSDNNVFFNDSITDNMHSLAPIKWDEYYCTSKSKHSSLLVSFLSILLRLCHFFGHDNTCYLLQCLIFLFCFCFCFFCLWSLLSNLSHRISCNSVRFFPHKYSLI